MIQVDTAIGTKPFAVLTAKIPCGQIEKSGCPAKLILVKKTVGGENIIRFVILVNQ